jgi:menaquinone-dependent protoporphyrinogen IX oxidase
MKGIVLYKSKYGHTKQYATWIADDLDFELKDFSKFNKRDIDSYETIIFGSGVYMGKMNQIKSVLKMFSNKPIIIFACAGNPGLEKEINDIKETNFNPEDLAYHKFFYLPGGVDFSKVKGFMKLLVNMFHFILKHKKNLTNDEKQILKGYTDPTYYVDKKYIKDIVDYVKSNKK